MQFDSPILFSEALDKLQARSVVPSSFDTFQWQLVPTAIRERSFFSARVESARVLQSMQDYLGDHLANTRLDNGVLAAHSRSEFVADMRELAIREGLGKVDPETGSIIPEIIESDLTDIRSISRLQLVFDTMTESAQEHGFWKQGQDPAILDVFPAQRFIRIRPVNAPRSYHEAALGEIRRKDDLPFWIALNRDFQVPWGPWGFNSGCGIEDVDRTEAVQAGVMSESDTVRPIEREFNAGLQASARDLDSGIAAALARTIGGRIAAGLIFF